MQLSITVVRGPAMDSATILTNLAGIPSGLVDVSDLNNFSTRRTSPWGTSRSLKLAGLSSGRDSNKRTNVRNSFKKDFFKLFSNSVLGKTMENILKTVYLKNVTDKKHYQNIARSQLMCHQKFLMRI